MVDLMQHWEKGRRCRTRKPTTDCSTRTPPKSAHWDCDFGLQDDGRHGSNFEHAIRNYYRPKEVTA